MLALRGRRQINIAFTNKTEISLSLTKLFPKTCFVLRNDCVVTVDRTSLPPNPLRTGVQIVPSTTAPNQKGHLILSLSFSE